MVAHGCQLSVHMVFFPEMGSHYVARLVLDYSSTVTSKVLDYRLLSPWPHCNTFSGEWQDPCSLVPLYHLPQSLWDQEAMVLPGVEPRLGTENKTGCFSDPGQEFLSGNILLK